ncbi:NPAS3 (predicted) [Pycnogonum litorale]
MLMVTGETVLMHEDDHGYFNAGYHGNALTQSSIHPTFTHSCILELRKEKSRDAARSRRTKENQEFYELAKLLPLPSAITTQLDKASVIRLTISYLKLLDFSGQGDPQWQCHPSTNHFNKQNKSRNRQPTTSLTVELFERHQGTHILQSLDGFAFALTPDGRFLYISETVSIYLGLSQVEVTGSSIFDYIHRDDHAEISEQFGLPNYGQNVPSPASVTSDEDASSTSSSGRISHIDDKPATPLSIQNDLRRGHISRSFCIRMKSTLTKRGCHFKCAGYRVVLVLSRMRPHSLFSQSSSNATSSGKVSPSLLGNVALAIALPPPSVNEVRLESDMFVTRLNFDFRIAHCEPRVEEYLDYTGEELTGRNMYSLCHGQDINKIRRCHVDLMSKGQVMSHYYRIMNKNGGCTWVQTCATVILNSKNADEQSIICVNYLISKTELNLFIMDSSQLEENRNRKPDDPNPDYKTENNSNCSSSDTERNSEDKRVGSNLDNTSPTQHCNGDGNCDTDDHKSSTNDTNLQVSLSCKNACDVNVDRPRSSTNSVECPSMSDVTRKRRRVDQDDSDKTCDNVISGATCDSVVESTNHEISNSRNKKSNKPESHSRNGDNDDDDDDDEDKDIAPIDVEREQQTNDEIDKQQLAVSSATSTTIQWIGSQQASSLSASALLRHIYANRESVIRSNFHSTNRPTYYGDVHPTLPTAASGESYLEQSQLLSKLTNHNSAYNSSVGYVDTCNGITSPSSVSPRDKYHCGIGDSPSYAAEMRQYVGDHGHIQPFSIKPQVYMNAATTTTTSLSESYTTQQATHDHHQQTPFYNTTGHPAGFHLYHSSINKVPLRSSPMSYIDGIKNGTSWYTQPSS